MGASLFVGAVRATKSPKRVRQSPVPHPLSRVSHAHPTNRNRRQRHSIQPQIDNESTPQRMPHRSVPSPKAKAKKKLTKEKVQVFTGSLTALGNASYYMLAQILFFMLAISAFSQEDTWYGFLIKPFKAGIILYTLSILFSVIAMTIAAISLKKFLKKMHVLTTFLLCLSGAVALPVIPWAGVWILATAYSTLSKK